MSETSTAQAYRNNRVGPVLRASPLTAAVVEAAEVILGGERHHTLTDGLDAKRSAYPSVYWHLLAVQFLHAMKPHACPVFSVRGNGLALIDCITRA